jgi:hypothetical protein
MGLRAVAGMVKSVEGSLSATKANPPKKPVIANEVKQSLCSWQIRQKCCGQLYSKRILHDLV